MSHLFSPSLPHPTPAARLRVLLLAAALASTLAACGGGGSTPAAPVTPPAPPVTPPQTVVLSATHTQLLAGGQPVTLTAAATPGGTVSWQLPAGAPGSLSASSGASVNYTPPANGVSAITPLTVTATVGGASQTIKLALYPDPGAPGVSFLAGMLSGTIDGSGTAARFTDIRDMARDASGNLYVSDVINGSYDANGNYRQPTAIRKVSASGVVSTVSKLPVGHADGDATHAQMGTIISLAVAPDNSIYLLESDVGYRIRVLHTDGSVSTLASLPDNGQEAAHLQVDHSGRVYAIGTFHINLVHADGSLTLLAGSSDSLRGSIDGLGAAASFGVLGEGALDPSGNLYVIDNASVRKVTPAGQVTSVAGVASGGNGLEHDGTGSAASFGQLSSIAADPVGNVQVLDRESGNGARPGYLIEQVTPAGVVTTIATGSDPVSALPSAAPPQYKLLRITASGAQILSDGGQLQRFGATGHAVAFAGQDFDSSTPVDGPGASARFVLPEAIAADLAGNAYVVDQTNFYSFSGGYQVEATGLVVRKVAPDGTVSTVITDAAFRVPSGIVADSAGNLYVVEIYPLDTLGTPPGGNIYKFAPDGSKTLLTNLSANSFHSPHLDGIDSSGNLYVDDLVPQTSTTNYYMVTPQAVISTIASLPASLNAAPDGNVYSVDSSQSVIYRTAPDGSKTVVAGVPGQSDTVLGPLPGSLAPVAIVPTGPGSFAVISGHAVLKLVVQH